MVLMALFTTFITTPLVTLVYKPARKSNDIYKHRTIERKDSTTQLRILACFYSSRNIPSLISLIEASRGTNNQQGLCVYAMHLMEMSERPSTILMVHKARKNGLPFWNKTLRSHSDHVVVAFEAFERLNHVSIRPMTCISDLSDMHEDVCMSAEKKHVAILIVPFHKHQRFDGVWETTRHEFRNVNRRILENAPCSVGILVDRGLGGATRVSSSDVSTSIAMLFFGGRDDREALCYGLRMAEHPGIKLTVIRFCASEYNGHVEEITVVDTNTGTLSDEQRFINKFCRRTQDDESVTYEERAVASMDDIMRAIRAVSRCNLFLVGRSSEGRAVLNLINVRADCPELGPVGSLLTLPNFPISASVLIVQQYSEKTMTGITLDSPGVSEESGC